MMNRILKAIIFFVILFTNTASIIHAQTVNEFKKQQDNEKNKFKEDYKSGFDKFVAERDQSIKAMDEEFEQFLKKEWANYTLFKAEKRSIEPKPTIKPVFKKSKKKTSVKLEINTVETLEAMPVTPRLPVLTKSVSNNCNLSSAKFAFYGSNLSFDYDANAAISIPSNITEEVISKKWKEMSGTNYNSILGMLDNYKASMNLNDWGYYLLIKKVASEISSDENVQVFTQWFLLTKSNYKARLAFKGSKLFILLPSVNNIYGKPFFTFDNLRYYLINGQESDVFTYDKDFPEARVIMDLNLYKPLNTVAKINTKPVSFDYNGKKYSFDVNYNKNAIDFYNDYPLADIEVYFDAAITPQAKQSLTDNLLPIIKDLSEEDAVSFLLNFVQTAFEYQTDEQQFGREKFFFPDELFYYKGSDCEDRAVLFAFLSKNLLGLDVVGLNYPGHMATAVKFSEDVFGNYINYKGEKYIVCDPTYAGAPIGQTMPQFAEQNAIVVELKSSQNLIGRERKLWKLANKNGLYQGGNGNNLIFDNDGNAYMCGYFKGNVDFFGYKLNSSQNSNDIFVAKISPENTVEYVFKVGSPGNDIAYNITLGKDESFYFTGSFNKDIKIGDCTLHVKNNSDLFLAKYSRNGDLKWVNQSGVEQLDSINNMFVSHFDEYGKKMWTRVYKESEDYTDYGITVDDAGGAFVTASLLASVGMDVSSKSYESYTEFNPIETLKKENDKLILNEYDPGIAGLFAVLHMINNSGQSLSGKQAQKALDMYNPTFRKKSPSIYNNIGKIEFIRNSQGIITIRTNDGNDVNFDAVRVRNNSKIKVAMFNSGNAQVDVLSGVMVGKAIIWYNLNYIKLSKTTGNLMFDYDADHTQKNINVKKDILY